MRSPSCGRASGWDKGPCGLIRDRDHPASLPPRQALRCIWRRRPGPFRRSGICRDRQHGRAAACACPKRQYCSTDHVRSACSGMGVRSASARFAISGARKPSDRCSRCPRRVLTIQIASRCASPPDPESREPGHDARLSKSRVSSKTAFRRNSMPSVNINNLPGTKKGSPARYKRIPGSPSHSWARTVPARIILGTRLTPSR
jgi:hypothetical protein